MTIGSALGVGLIAAFLLAVVIGLNAWLLVPLAVLALAAFFAAPIAALFKAGDVGTKTAPTGTTSTREAAYEPVEDPADRATHAR
jgi:hypothetical protein